MVTREQWERLFFQLLIAVAVFYAIASWLFIFEPGFVPKAVIDFVGSISFGVGAVYFFGLPWLPVVILVVTGLFKFLRYFTD